MITAIAVPHGPTAHIDNQLKLDEISLANLG